MWCLRIFDTTWSARGSRQTLKSPPWTSGCVCSSTEDQNPPTGSRSEPQQVERSWVSGTALWEVETEHRQKWEFCMILRDEMETRVKLELLTETQSKPNRLSWKQVSYPQDQRLEAKRHICCCWTLKSLKDVEKWGGGRGVVICLVTSFLLSRAESLSILDQSCSQLDKPSSTGVHHKGGSHQLDHLDRGWDAVARQPQSVGVPHTMTREKLSVPGLASDLDHRVSDDLLHPGDIMEWGIDC